MNIERSCCNWNEAKPKIMKIIMHLADQFGQLSTHTIPVDE